MVAFLSSFSNFVLGTGFGPFVYFPIHLNWLDLLGSLSVITTLILGWLKLRDIRQTRFRLELLCDFADEEHGNHLHVQNLSDKTVLINNWELVSRPKKGWKREYVTMESAPDIMFIKVAPHETETITFLGLAHFDPNSIKLEGKELALMLDVAGRGRVKLKARVS